MNEEKLAEAEQMGLHKKFKLESNLNTSNMVMTGSLPLPYINSDTPWELALW